MVAMLLIFRSIPQRFQFALPSDTAAVFVPFFLRCVQLIVMSHYVGCRAVTCCRCFNPSHLLSLLLYSRNLSRCRYAMDSDYQQYYDKCCHCVAFFPLCIGQDGNRFKWQQFDCLFFMVVSSHDFTNNTSDNRS